MKHFGKITEISRELALAALKIKAIKIRPDKPFTWASGLKSPIYNDNRMLLFFPEYRELVIEGLYELRGLHGRYFPEIIAGTSTAGIPHGYGLAQRCKLPFIYVRDKAKDHGMKNRIEGIDADGNLEGKSVLLIEDLISTGGSSVNAVQAIRDANGEINLCFSIFSYGFPKAKEMFAGRASFLKDEDRRLSQLCRVDSILEYQKLIKTAIKSGYVQKDQRKILEEWSADPEKWSNEFKARETEKA